MLPAHSDFQTLLLRLLDGSEEAATELVARFSLPLRIVIRRHLDHRVRPVLDSVDLEQQVWASFFGRELYRDTLDDPAKLGEFLRGIARNKSRKASRDYLRDKRDRGREIPLESASLNGLSEASHQEKPDEIAQHNDDWTHSLASLSKQHRAILELLRERYSLAEVAAKLGVSIRTVSRVLADVRRRRRQLGQ